MQRLVRLKSLEGGEIRRLKEEKYGLIRSRAITYPPTAAILHAKTTNTAR